MSIAKNRRKKREREEAILLAGAFIVFTGISALGAYAWALASMHPW